MSKITKYSFKTVQLLLIGSLVIFINACSDGGSSNSNNDSDTETSQDINGCPTNEPRCEARDNF